MALTGNNHVPDLFVLQHAPCGLKRKEVRSQMNKLFEETMRLFNAYVEGQIDLSALFLTLWWSRAC